MAGRGVIALLRGDYVRARRLLEEALAIRRSLNDLWGIGYSTRELGYVAIAQGDYAGAEGCLHESLDAFTTVGATGGTVLPSASSTSLL